MASVINSDPIKLAIEVTFSRKKTLVNHLIVLFKDIPIEKVNEHKHLDSKLSFVNPIQSVTLKCGRRIGMIKSLSKYLPRKTLNELYKLYVQPHLGYGDVIYHIPPNKCKLG